jgi:hypothetical protein
MVYENCKIYGPYLGKDKRLRIIVKFSNGTKTTVSYPNGGSFRKVSGEE